MDEEELGSTGKKITIANFFESIKKIDKVADDALKSSKLNLGKIDVATEEIKKLQQIVASIQTDIQTLKDDDKIRRNELEDRLLEQQDALQKAQMIAKQQEIKGEKGEKVIRELQARQAKEKIEKILLSKAEVEAFSVR